MKRKALVQRSIFGLLHSNRARGRQARWCAWPIVGLLLAVAATPSSAAVISLGQQDFSNGQIVEIGPYLTAQSGESAPFDGFIGTDPIGPNFVASWSFSYSALSATSASITLGLFDHDSSYPGAQVEYFTVDGIDLTADFSALLEASGGDQQEYNIYTLPLEGTALAALSDGSATFTLSLQGLSHIGGFPYNGAGLDFSTLAINDVPEPGTLALLGLGIVGISTSRGRKQ